MQAFGHELAESSFGGKFTFEVLLYTPPELSILTREHTVLLSAEVLDLLRMAQTVPEV